MYTMAHRLLEVVWTQRSFDEEIDVPETIAEIVAAHCGGSVSPAETVARTYRRIREHGDPAIFISLRDEKEAIAEAEGLARKSAADLPEERSSAPRI